MVCNCAVCSKVCNVLIVAVCSVVWVWSVVWP
jgi:hypothetical protein